MARPAAATRVVAGRAVPLSRALADLNVAREEPRGAILREDATATGASFEAFPISTSIGSMLDEACMQPRKALPPRKLRQPEQLSYAPPPSQNVTTGSAAVANGWHPLLQVDRVVWPAIHNRLQSSAQASIEQMTDGLQAIGDSGRRIIGLASCASGEGVTTLLSVAARKLLSRGRKVALVDGNWSNPQLAKCLGLLPQMGWEDLRFRAAFPWKKWSSNRFADGLADLAGPRIAGEPPSAKTAIAVGLEILAREFDFNVLVDLGPFERIAEDATTPASNVSARMDAVVLVQNVRVTPPHRLGRCRNEQLAASNLRYAGTIQNFVAG